MPTEHSLERISWSVILSKAALKSICTVLASCPLSNAHGKVWDTHEGIISSECFPISELGGWIHTSAFHKLISRTDTKRSITTNCPKLWTSVICNRKWMWTFWNWGEIDLSSASTKTTKRRSPCINNTETRSQNVIYPFNKRGNLPIKGQFLYRCPSPTRVA